MLLSVINVLLNLVIEEEEKSGRFELMLLRLQFDGKCQPSERAEDATPVN